MKIISMKRIRLEKGEMKGIVWLMLVALFLIIPGQAIAAQLEIDDQTGAMGSEVSFTVSARNTPSSASSFFIDIGFDPTVLQFQTVDFSGSLVDNFDAKQVSIPEPGMIRIYGTVGHVWQSVTIGATGIFARLSFAVIGNEDCKVTFKRLEGDVASWSTKDGSFKITKKLV